MIAGPDPCVVEMDLPVPRPVPDYIPQPECWTCTIGETTRDKLPDGADGPMREAIRRAYVEITGEDPDFIFSGWGHELPEVYRAVHENRLPRDPEPLAHHQV